MLADATGDAALVFTCNGRGQRLFGEPDHDARVVADTLGSPAARRHVLRRRDRPGRRAQLRPRLHRQRPCVPRPVTREELQRNTTEPSDVPTRVTRR